PRVEARSPAPATPESARPSEGECTAPGAHFAQAKRAPKPLTRAQEERIDKAEEVVRGHPPPWDAEARSKLAGHRYARALALFEANRWAEAGLAFREIAMDSADLEVGVHAAVLYLEALDVLGSSAEPPRPVCYDDMARDVPRLI